MFTTISFIQKIAFLDDDPPVKENNCYIKTTFTSHTSQTVGGSIQEGKHGGRRNIIAI